MNNIIPQIEVPIIKKGITSKATLSEELKDKRVIIVGPSSYLENMKSGKFIDSFDIVVRINNIHDLNTINEVLLEDDTMSRSTRRFSWSHDSKLFVFTKMGSVW